jgi:hypothetical protein
MANATLQGVTGPLSGPLVIGKTGGSFSTNGQVFQVVTPKRHVAIGSVILPMAGYNENQVCDMPLNEDRRRNMSIALQSFCAVLGVHNKPNMN